jgi:hypothetical protein
MSCICRRRPGTGGTGDITPVADQIAGKGGTMEYVKWVAKALLAAAIAFVGSLVQATQDGSGITLVEWLVAAGFALAALAGVFKVGNGPKPARR